ncbi:tachykinins [Bombyx mandarina]|uniref:Tachykinins n=1 Tax=Bombyx mandarina TaxID=7092 RepID=A0A6J2KAC2_BOMMA|nr:tachykinins [Bombyx mandarina]
MGTYRACLVLLILQVISIATAQEMIKRIPQGFLGMRGKKHEDDSSEQYYKRKPQFFVGVKGKKNFYDYLENSDGYFKRAPLGFTGVRGKKEDMSSEYQYYPYEALKRDGSLIGQIEYSSAEHVNDGQYPILNDILNEYLQKLERQETNSDTNETEEQRITNEVEKRAANMHQFYGVRGKKSVDNKRPYDLSIRGKFIGVRGKKDVKNSNGKEIKFLLSRPFPKRRGQMGFFGMRGKKWIDVSSPEMEIPN